LTGGDGVKLGDEYVSIRFATVTGAAVAEIAATLPTGGFAAVTGAAAAEIDVVVPAGFMAVTGAATAEIDVVVPTGFTAVTGAAVAETDVTVATATGFGAAMTATIGATTLGATLAV
jgi:hypothetical protein